VDPRCATPGSEAAAQFAPGFAELSSVTASSLKEGSSLDQYLRFPEEGRVGVCCSGGGIRSASYALGALQALRKDGVLNGAEYLASVSGGGYSAIAHTLLVAATAGDFGDNPGTDLRNAFQDLPPWAQNSPEEINLRQHPDYLGSKIWLIVTLVYGMLRHLLPFAAGIVLAATLTGFALNPWIGRAIQGSRVPLPRLLPPAIVALALVVVSAGVLTLRQFLSKRDHPNGSQLQTLQTLTLLLLRSALATALFLVGLPALLLALSKIHEGAFTDLVVAVVASAGSLGGLLLVLSYLARRGRAKRLLPFLTAIAGPLLLAIPYVGVTYIATQDGFHWNPPPTFSRIPLILMIASAAALLAFWFFDEVTASMHLFYKERLSSSFVGYRRAEDSPGNGRPTRRFVYRQPPWSTALSFSKVLSDPREPDKTQPARLPKLVVCAAVNLREVPPGRNAASFTFEHDYSGGPVTGYTRTRSLEELAREGVLTLPAMMAISGAALAPSMGRMTRPRLRLLMALFNVRLGVWLPNPKKGSPWLSTWSLREALKKPPPEGPRTAGPQAAEGHQSETPPVVATEVQESRSSESPPAAPREVPTGLRGVVRRLGTRLRRPGTLYILREVLGLMTLKSDYVYVTDGGHWDNLGLVELLRRGCTQILCFDAAGDDLEHFHTLGQAIALARSDLGVEIEIDAERLRPLKPDADGFSKTDVVRAEIRYPYPAGARGVLVFAKASLPKTGTPQDLISFREIDPKFPTHPTSDQFFDERKFEAYRALGYQAGTHAVRRLDVWRAENDFEPFQATETNA
jgi:hypothetical protein